MAGTQITTYTTIITESMRGYQNITLTNWTNTNEPLIAEGGRTEIKGSLFKFDADEDVDPDADWAGFAMSTQIYGYYVVAGANVTSKLTTTAPTWSEEFGCWMDAGETYRYWGGIYKDSGGNYADKFIYAGRSLKHSYNFDINERGGIDCTADCTFSGDVTFSEIILNEGGLKSNSYSFNNQTQNTIYASLGSYVPTIGDKIIVSGSHTEFSTDEWKTFNTLDYLERITSTQIKLRFNGVVSTGNSIQGLETINNGSTAKASVTNLTYDQRIIISI